MEMQLFETISILLILLYVSGTITMLVGSLMAFVPSLVYHLFFAPGVILHELAHLIFAIIADQKIKSFVPYRPQGRDDGTMGYVEYTGGAISFVSIAPFFICIPIGMYLMDIFCGGDYPMFPIKLHTYNGILKQWQEYWRLLCDGYRLVWVVVQSFFRHLGEHDLKYWLKVYFFASIACSWMPSSHDLLCAWPVLIALNFAIWLLRYIPWDVPFWAQEYVLRLEWTLIFGSGFALFFALAAFAVGLLVKLISK